MASFTSILSDIGNVLKKVFGVVTTIAVAAEPIVAVAFPGLSTLYTATVTEVINAENAAIVAGQQNGTGTQKLALVVNAIEDQFNTWAAANGVAASSTTVEAWVNAVVASLNAIPATTKPAA